MNVEGGGWLPASPVRLEGAAAAVKATTTATRNKNKFMIPDEIREIAAVTAHCKMAVKFVENLMPAGVR